MLQNPNPRWGSLQGSPDSLTDGTGLATPAKNLTPALGPSGLVSAGLRV